MAFLSYIKDERSVFTKRRYGVLFVKIRFTENRDNSKAGKYTSTKISSKRIQKMGKESRMRGKRTQWGTIPSNKKQMGPPTQSSVSS